MQDLMTLLKQGALGGPPPPKARMGGLEMLQALLGTGSPPYGAPPIMPQVQPQPAPNAAQPQQKNVFMDSIGMI